MDNLIKEIPVNYIEAEELLAEQSITPNW